MILSFVTLSDVRLLGSGLRIDKGTRVTAVRATNQPNTRQWFIHPVGRIWPGIGKTADPNDSILITEEEIPEFLGFHQPGNESRIPRLVPRVEPTEAEIVDWTEALFDQKLGMHPDDPASEIVNRAGQLVYTSDEAIEMDLILDYLHAVKCLNTNTPAVDIYTDTALRYMHAGRFADELDNPESQAEELRRLLYSRSKSQWLVPHRTGWYWMWSGITHEQPTPVEIIQRESSELFVINTAHKSDYRKLLVRLVESGYLFSEINKWPELVKPNSDG